MPGRLSIVIPALDEEAAIGETVSRCLAAREHLCAAAGLDSVEDIIGEPGPKRKTSPDTPRNAPPSKS